MKILVYEAPKTMHHDVVADFPLGPNDLRVKTLYTGVSHGTEMGVYRNLVPQFSKINDPVLRLLLPADKAQTWNYPLRSCDPGSWGLGYSNVGRVVEKGADVKDFEIGDVVYSASPHQTQVVKDAGEFLKVPADIDPKYVIFFFNLNTTYNAILDAKIKLGDVVVVSGLGLLGQLCAQMARMSGASRVYGIDTYENRRKAAEANGCDATFNPATDGDIALKMQGGFALPLDQYAAEKGWNDRVEGEFLGNCSYDGVLYGLPLATQCTWGLMFYNADFFAENGLEIPMYPTTEETVALCAKIRELGKQPIAIGNVDLWPGVLLFGDYFVQKAGQDLVDQLKSGEVRWDESDVVRGCLEEMAKLGQSGAFTSGYEVQDHSAAIESFVNGTCAMMYMGTWWVQYVENGFDGINFKLGTIASPRFDGVQMAQSAQLFANQATFIYSGTKNPDLAADWLDFYCADACAAAQYADCTAQTFSPSYNATLDINEQFANSEAYVKSYEEAKKINYFDWHFSTAVTDSLKVSIQKLFSGDITVDEALSDIEATAAEER